MTPSAYVEYLQSLPFTDYLIPLWGDKKDERGEKKTPIASAKGWNTADFAQRFTYDDAVEHVAGGGWLGIKIKKGYVCVDIDDPETAEAVRRVYGRQTYSVPSLRGVHLLYIADGVNRTTSNLVLERFDWLDWHKYIVAPYAEPFRIPNDLPVAEIPIEFVIPPTGETRELWKRGKRIYQLRDGDGRNSLLFSIGRKVRLYLANRSGAENEIADVLYRVNDLFAEPLSPTEVDKVLHSVLATPDREEITRTPIVLTEREGEGNPFLQIVPLKDIASEKRQFFIDFLCREGDVVLLAGSPKSGKSTLCRSIALSCAPDAEHLIPVNRRGWVLWYALEENPADIRDAVEKAQSVYGVGYDHIQVCSVNVNHPDPLSLFIQALDEVLQVSPVAPVAIIVDTVGRIFGSGVDINNYSLVQEKIEAIRWVLRKYPNPPVVFLVHHLNKGGVSGEKTPLGSQAFMGACDVVALMTEGVLRVVGRGVPTQEIHTYYDPDGDVTLLGAPTSEMLYDLMRDIRDGRVTTLKDAMQYQGGVLKSDVKRLLRQGVLLVYQDKLFINEFSRRAKHLLTKPEVITHAPKPRGTEEGIQCADECPDKSGNSLFADTCGISSNETTGHCATGGHEGRGERSGEHDHNEEAVGATECALQVTTFSDEEWAKVKIQYRADEPPVGGKLLRRNTVPPVVRRALLTYLYLLKRDKNTHLYLSDIDPFADDTVSFAKPQVNNCFIAIKKRFGDRMPTAEEILQFWEERQETDFVSLLNALYAHAKRPYEVTPKGFVRCIAYPANGRWALLPVEGLSGVEKDRLVALLAKSPDTAIELGSIPATVKRIAELGLLFNLYEVNGKPVYVLSRDHAVVETESDLEQYILEVTYDA